MTVTTKLASIALFEVKAIAFRGEAVLAAYLQSMTAAAIDGQLRKHRDLRFAFG